MDGIQGEKIENDKTFPSDASSLFATDSQGNLGQEGRTVVDEDAMRELENEDLQTCLEISGLLTSLETEVSLSFKEDVQHFEKTIEILESHSKTFGLPEQLQLKECRKKLENFKAEVEVVESIKKHSPAVALALTGLMDSIGGSTNSTVQPSKAGMKDQSGTALGSQTDSLDPESPDDQNEM